MNFEGGYYVLPDLSIGAFINYHTNNEYISRQTLPLSNSAALTTDQQHSVFQLPFGFATHYRFSDGAVSYTHLFHKGKDCLLKECDMDLPLSMILFPDNYYKKETKWY